MGRREAQQSVRCGRVGSETSILQLVYHLITRTPRLLPPPDRIGSARPPRSAAAGERPRPPPISLAVDQPCWDGAALLCVRGCWLVALSLARACTVVFLGSEGVLDPLGSPSCFLARMVGCLRASCRISSHKRTRLRLP
ncbi:unnamed protein product [Urochloa humidicola]